MIASNNPFNIKFVFSIHWKGLVGQHEGFCMFDTLNNGARAGCIDLKNAQVLHKLNTVGTIIPHYAPPNENDTKAYIAAVCADMNVTQDEPLNLTQKGPLYSLGAAVWHHEQGQRADTVALTYGVAAATGFA